MRISDWSSDVCSSDLCQVVFYILPTRRLEIRYPQLHGAAGLIRSEGDHWEFKAPHRIRIVDARETLDCRRDRKSVVSGKRVSVRVDLGGRRIIKKKMRSSTKKQGNRYKKNRAS